MIAALKKLGIISVLAICLLGCESSVTSKEESHIEVIWETGGFAHESIRKIKVDNLICYQTYRGGIWCHEDKERE